ncbi:MAG: L,D-transpeptidase family protein [Candidatus Xenobiia bacterium LiM19]
MSDIIRLQTCSPQDYETKSHTATQAPSHVSPSTAGSPGHPSPTDMTASAPEKDNFRASRELNEMRPGTGTVTAENAPHASFPAFVEGAFSSGNSRLPVASQTKAKQDSAQNGSVKNARFNDETLRKLAQDGKMGPGTSGEHIKKIQQALLDLGFNIPEGPTGAYGNNTKNAMSGFQKSQNLPVTGVLDSSTFRNLDEVAPAPGKKAWEDPHLSPRAFPPAQKVNGEYARALVNKSEHRLFLYDSKGALEKIYPVATGKEQTPTQSGVKVVNGKLEDPSKVAAKLWPESGGKAFGTRLFDLSWFDEKTGTVTKSGQELHGTYNKNSIGKNASHGCMRMNNRDIEELFKRVKKGDRIIVRE